MNDHLPKINQNNIKCSLNGSRIHHQSLKSDKTNWRVFLSEADKAQNFDLNLNKHIPAYNALKDQYLQQFFRRQTRQVILSGLAESGITKEKKHQSAINKSKYQNIINEINKNPYLKQERKNVILLHGKLD